MSSAAEPRRVVQLDVLRALAVLLVFGRHAVIQPEEAGRLAPFAGAWHRIGWSGVDLFFVLSGFLVGGLLFKELRTRSALDVRRFIIRRGFKIWPAYYAYLAFVFFMFAFVDAGVDSWSTAARLLPNLFHFQNYAEVPRLGIRLAHTWSLAVEEHFYLVLPVLLLALTRGSVAPVRSIPALPWIAGGCIVACLALRLLTWIAAPQPGAMHRWPTHLRIDSLFLGVLLGYLHHFEPQRFARFERRRTELWIAALVLISTGLLFGEDHPFIVTIGFTLLHLGYGCLLVAALCTPLGSGAMGAFFASRAARLLAFVGLHSYSIYLWHVSLARIPMLTVASLPPLLRLPASLRWLIVVALYVALACGVGIVLGKLIEWPALRARDRWFPARADALPQTPAAA